MNHIIIQKRIDLGNQLKEIRERLFISPENVLDTVGIKPYLLARIEAGKVNIDINLLIMLTSYYKVDIIIN